VMRTNENPGAKTMSVVAEPSPSTELCKGALGLGFIIFFVISAAGPLVAIAGGFPIGIMLGNGAGTPALLVATVVILLMFSAGYTAMSRHVTNAGGFYAFTARGLGGTAGGAAALIALLGYNTMQIGLYGMFGAVASGFLSAHFNLNTPWWICSLAAMASIGVFGYRQIDLSAKVLSLLVFGEYIVVLILDLAILKSGGDSGINAASFTPHTFMSGTPAIGFLFCFASFIGFEATTIYSEDLYFSAADRRVLCVLRVVHGDRRGWRQDRQDAYSIKRSDHVPLHALRSLRQQDADRGDERAVHHERVCGLAGFSQLGGALFLCDRP